MDRNTVGNIVLKASYKRTTPGELKFCHFNPGSAISNISEIRQLFHNVEMHVICISESWYKDWHTAGHVEIPGYQVIRADRRDGRRGGGVAMYVDSNLRVKTLARSPDNSSIDFLFVEIIFHGVPIMMGLVYNPPGIDGLNVYTPFLRSYCSRYIHNILVGDFNVNLLESSTAAGDFRTTLDEVSMKIVSSEPTHFQAREPTLIDICAVSEHPRIKLFSQIPLPGMSTQHDLIYGAYKVCEVTGSSSNVSSFTFRDYKRSTKKSFNMMFCLTIGLQFTILHLQINRSLILTLRCCNFLKTMFL